MSTLTSSSTDAQVRAAYDDNASYEEDASLAKCRAFITAVRILLRREKTSMADQGSNIAYDRKLLQDELDEARTWLAENGGGTEAQGMAVTHADFTSFRD